MKGTQGKVCDRQLESISPRTGIKNSNSWAQPMIN